jgi:hypothetical protein
LNSLVTLMTLIIRAICGPTLITLSEFADIFAITMSKKLAETTKKSNLFQPELKKFPPCAINFVIHSSAKAAVKK